jgi:two-component system, cell cycle sensor histidine kinase and response regulator CckA
MTQRDSLPQRNGAATNDTNLFHEEDRVLRTAEEYLAAGRDSEISWFERYRELVSGYRNLLRHAKLLMNVGDLMQNDLNSKNEQLKSAQEREEGLRAQLVHSQKMEAIGALTGGIAHDFNNLLTVINGYSEMILSEKTEDDPIRPDVLRILESGRKGAEIVKHLLAFSSKADISPMPQDLSHIVENSIKLMEGTFPKGIKIEKILGRDLGTVNVDAAQMEQVIINLCINAKEAMPQGGRLRIETRSVTVDADYCRSHPGTRPGRTALLEVSDTGVGIDKETMARLFDPFFTTKGLDFRKGTGLGLSVAKGIVEQHGGWITCESAPNEGTTFKVYLPVLEAEGSVE